jgi:hypothetical protein
MDQTERIEMAANRVNGQWRCRGGKTPMITYREIRDAMEDLEDGREAIRKLTHIMGWDDVQVVFNALIEREKRQFDNTSSK